MSVSELTDLDSLELTQGLSAGLAVLSTDSRQILFENASFFIWFPAGSNPNAPLPERVPGLNMERAQSRLSAGRAHTFEVEAKSGARTISIAGEIRSLGDATSGQAVVECQDISKQKPIE